MRRFTLSDEQLTQTLAALDTARVALVGDFCLDVYWHADMTISQLSRETPHYPLPIVGESMSLGGAGNVAANMAALAPKTLFPICAIGQDWRGRALLDLLDKQGINREHILIDPDMITPTYIKPIRKGISPVEYEDPRLDFANYAPLSSQTQSELIRRLRIAVQNVDLLCVADQLPFGCITPIVRDEILRLAADGLPVLVDSRDTIHLFNGPNIILKPNHIEAARALGVPPAPEDDLDAQAKILKDLAAACGCAILMTLGPMGCLCGDASSILHIPAQDVPPPLDFVGAGDTFLSAAALALAAGLPQHTAAALGNRASAITIRKIGITGTATRAEIAGA